MFLTTWLIYVFSKYIYTIVNSRRRCMQISLYFLIINYTVERVVFMEQKKGLNKTIFPPSCKFKY